MVYLTPESDDERLLVSHISDMITAASERCTVRYSLFLNERQAALAVSKLNASGYGLYRLYGGYADAVRRMLCVYTEYDCPEDESYPLSAVVFSYRKADVLTHRDFLGALMSLGIKRETVGDIVVSEGSCTAFLCDTVLPIAEQIDKVGRVGVRTTVTKNASVSAQERFSESGYVVSSLRADCVVSAVTGLSRAKASDVIAGGIELNCRMVFSGSQLMNAGDVFAVRGYGKFVLSDEGTLTKKGRLHITVKKYL